MKLFRSKGSRRICRDGLGALCFLPIARATAATAAAPTGKRSHGKDQDFQEMTGGQFGFHGFGIYLGPV